MKASNLLLATLKETPADAQVISHQLMLRAGMIRKLSAGLYVWLPLGQRVLQKVINIVREEMNNAGSQEMGMTIVQPAEIWEESGRWEEYGKELLRLNDRHDNAFCLGPTHEEVVTTIMRSELKSYKQLPLSVYQIQTKFRDEIRPRFGVMRAREFLMKDAYSFDIDDEAMEKSFQAMYEAYHNIFTRLQLNFRAVLADTGSIGGDTSFEFCVLAESGEDDIAFSDESDYAANVEKAAALPPELKDRSSEFLDSEIFATPNAKTIDELAEHYDIPANNSVKTLFVHGSETPLIALVLRGDHALNEIKADHLPEVKSPLTFASEEETVKLIGANFGSLGPVNLSAPIIVDLEAAALVNFTCGANENKKHIKNVNWGRDAHYAKTADLRNVLEGDKSPDGKGCLQIKRGIEVGHIFQLGEKYSKPMNLTVLDQQGKASIVKMGCYGIGVSRVVAAAIEQNHDENGIIWPESMAPFNAVIIPIGADKSVEVANTAEKLYDELTKLGIDVLLDDRKERPGVKFADMDLIGIPHRIVIGEKHLKDGNVEYRHRREAENKLIAIDKVISLFG